VPGPLPLPGGTAAHLHRQGAEIQAGGMNPESNLPQRAQRKSKDSYKSIRMIIHQKGEF
jgi:hypothetical protein